MMQPDSAVGIIGLGLIGSALSQRLLDAKLRVIGFDINPVRCGKLTANGGAVATSVRDLAGRARAIVIAVYSGEQVEALFDDVVSGAGPARPTVICTTTCAPDEIVRVAERAAGAHIPLVEAPISGTSVEVRDGSATALVAGETDAITAAGALLDVLCPRRAHVGKTGDASRTKLAIDLILQSNRAALAEAIVFAERLGLDGPAFLAAARQSVAYSRVMDSKGEKMLARDFRPQSHISQTLKDAELILAEAARRGLCLPMTSVQADLLRSAIALEGPDSDSAAVIEAIRRPVSPEVSR
jgi:3-hydroxyisobutyrate dehydrogenase-like beta-hydroxyacid dehydrogenase